MMKTKLRTLVRNGQIFLQAVSVEQTVTYAQTDDDYVGHWGETNDTASIRTKSKVIHSHEKAKQCPVELSESFLSAWLYHTIPAMCYNLLECMYRKATGTSQEKILWQYKIECLRFIHDYGVNDDFDFFVNEDCMPTTKVTMHSSTMVTFTDGTRHKLECIPHFEVTFTDIGKKLSQVDDTTDYQSDVMDIIQIGIETAMKLVKMGLIQSFRGLWAYQSGIQSAMRKYIYSNKVIADTTEYSDLMVVSDSNGNDTIFHGKCIKSALSRFEISEIRKAISDCLYVCLATSRCRDKMVKAFTMYYFDDIDIDTIAKEIDVNSKSVYRYLLSIKRKIQESATLNELLHNVICDRLMAD